MKKNISFVILHYKTINDTNTCIDSIKKYIKKNNYNIVVVDNYSNNGTLEQLQEKYKNDNKVIILGNNENLGFAKGNNVGYQYAKKNLSPDFIIMCNSDTELINDSFEDVLIDDYYKYNYAVLGPKILLKDGSINPLRGKLPSITSLKRSILYRRLEIILTKCKLLFVYDFFKEIKKTRLNNYDVNKKWDDILLHGCFWIFSKNYINKFEGLNSKTFLYREEELLYLNVIINGLHTIYDPNLVIIHNEDGSTNAINKTPSDKRLFVAKNQIISTKILIDELKNYKGDILL